MRVVLHISRVMGVPAQFNGCPNSPLCSFSVYKMLESKPASNSTLFRPHGISVLNRNYALIGKLAPHSVFCHPPHVERVLPFAPHKSLCKPPEQTQTC